MANTFKRVIDRQIWVQVPPAPNAHAAAGCVCTDMRNDESRHPFVHHLVSNAILNRYNIVSKSWNLAVNPGLGGTFAVGAGCVFVPSHSLTGAIGAGCSNTSIVTTTVITAVGVNMLANRGGGTYGFKVRIIGSSAAGSGLTEERWIVGNTGGTTPTFLLDTALTFVPAVGDVYEVLSGRVMVLGAGALAATIFRSFNVATNALASLANVNLPASITTDSVFCCLDEQYVPYDHKPGEGFVIGASSYDATVPKLCLVATATAAGTITGQAAAGDAAVLQNEYRNFQIRIVEDTAIPTAVGQRRIIASHTAGASPVYTLGTNWAVTPTATAKYVIEYPNLLLLWTTANAVTYTYNYGPLTVNNGTNSILTNAWHVTYVGNRGGNMGIGCTVFPSFGIEPDAAKNARHSFIFTHRGAAATTLDLLDLAGGAGGLWSAAIVYDGAVATTTGTSYCYSPTDFEGRYGYLNVYVASAINQMQRFDVKNRVLSPFTPTDWIQAGTAAGGNRLSAFTAIDGTDRYCVLLLITHLSTVAMEMVVQT